MTQSIAVIVPAFNASRFIEQSLDSILSQTRAPEELIVIDDGSTDETAEIVSNWSRRNLRSLRLIRQQNGGLPAARNTGITASNSELFALLDADDILLPDHLETLEKPFDNSLDIALCFGDAEAFEGDAVIRESYLKESSLMRLPNVTCGEFKIIDGSVFSGLIAGSRIANCSTLVRGSAARTIGLYDESIRRAEDRDFWLRLSRVGRFAYTERVVSRVRRHDNNLTHRRNKHQVLKDRAIVVAKTLRNQEEMMLSESEISIAEQVLRRTQHRILSAASREGLGVYSSQALEFLRKGHFFPLVDARGILRSVVRSCQWR